MKQEAATVSNTRKVDLSIMAFQICYFADLNIYTVNNMKNNEQYYAS